MKQWQILLIVVVVLVLVTMVSGCTSGVPSQGGAGNQASAPLQGGLILPLL
jgi:hypothetical protein